MAISRSAGARRAACVLPLRLLACLAASFALHGLTLLLPASAWEIPESISTRHTRVIAELLPPSGKLPRGGIARAAATAPVPRPISRRYYWSDEVDRAPLALVSLHDALPPGSGPDHGSLRLNLLIDEAGRIETVRVVDSLLDAEESAFVANAVRNLRFEPGRLGATPVPTQLLLQLDFADRDAPR